MSNYTKIPTKIVGPIKITGEIINDEVSVPMATYETTLWASTSRGAKLSRLCDGIKVSMIDERMTRSVVVKGKDASSINKIKSELELKKDDLQKVVETTSSFAKLIDLHFSIIGNLLFIRFEFLTGEASGHNMTTKASDALLRWICDKYGVEYISVSGNMCTDKKVSAINGILGRGKNMIAEIVVPENVCKDVLKTMPRKIVDLNIQKNLIGSILAGSIRSANAHYANILLACYLATGQDGANVVEGSQGITYAEVMNDGSLYFSINCPNIIVGTIGNGKDLEDVAENLKLLNCFGKSNNKISNSVRLAGIIASAVLCSELSLLAAQTNVGELMKAHETIERNKK